MSDLQKFIELVDAYILSEEHFRHSAKTWPPLDTTLSNNPVFTDDGEGGWRRLPTQLEQACAQHRVLWDLEKRAIDERAAAKALGEKSDSEEVRRVAAILALPGDVLEQLKTYWLEVKPKFQSQDEVSDSWKDHVTLANDHQVDAEALRKRLATFRKKNHGGWREVADRAANEPAYLYSEASVRSIIDDMLRAGQKVSGKRPARK